MGGNIWNKTDNISAIDRLKDELFPDSWLAKQDARILAARRVQNVCYFVIETAAPSAFADSCYVAKDGKIVSAVIVLIRDTAKEFGYKDMSETMGPHDSKCPDALLDLLSDLKPGSDGPTHYAAEWRSRCRAHNAAKRSAPKLVDGIQVKLPSPVKFTDGISLDTFTVRIVKRRGRNKTLFQGQNGFYYRISGDNRSQLRVA